ncbi:MAG: hypothetical protein QOH32_3978 [Bradyrhizobium sp.]|jgi:hypothetical protein|nr:hypothetical protein [Bradyrhizobium sp.]
MAKDAFDQWQEWANKPADSDLSIPSDLHAAVSALAPEQQADRQAVNEAVREARDPNTEYRWVYENGDRQRTFRSEAEGEAWLKQNDPEGVLWKERLGPLIPAGTADQNGVPVAADET